MDTNIKQTIEESVAASYAGTRNFPTHVKAIADHGVESYRVDFRELASTYFVSSGDSHTIRMPPHQVAITDAFDESAVIATLRAVQQGQIKYPEFVDRAMQAGCVGYTVWVAGRHVVYFGRRGETYIERFPPQLLSA